MDRFLQMGDSTIYFFFILSGYILAFVYLRGGHRVAARSFYISRFARIYPLYFVTLLADFPFAVAYRVARYGFPHAIERVLVLFVSSLIFLQVWIQASAGINGPGWTLGVETVFYLGFPIFGIWLWRLKRRGNSVAMLVLFLVGLAINNAIAAKAAYARPALDLGSYQTLFWIGILIAHRQAMSTADKENQIRTAWISLILGVLGFGAVLLASPELVQHHIRPDYLLTPVFGAWIWALSLAQFKPARLLSARWLVLLGEASFGFYLVHYPILHVFRAFHMTGAPWNYPLYLGTCIFVSILSFRYFESPARRLILDRFHARSLESGEAATSAS
jgi:peptidoglycan/LPS O-acetylase OafA/YrhL